MSSIVIYIINCIEKVKEFFYKSCGLYNDIESDTDSVNSFQETLIELKSVGDNHVFETESIVNLHEVQHYYEL